MNKTPYQTELLFQYGIRYSVYKIMDGYNNILISIIQIYPSENTNTGERYVNCLDSAFLEEDISMVMSSIIINFAVHCPIFGCILKATGYSLTLIKSIDTLSSVYLNIN